MESTSATESCTMQMSAPDHTSAEALLAMEAVSKYLAAGSVRRRGGWQRVEGLNGLRQLDEP